MSLSWFIIRGSGVAAFALIASALLWGLLTSSRVLGRAVGAKALQRFHESLGLGALLATIIHIVAVRMDTFVEFTWRDILVPGASQWEPLATTLGAVGFWSLAVVTLTFYVKRWIGHDRWRALHYLAFGTFLASLLHATLAGTDGGNPYLLGLYLSSLVAIVLLTVIRVVTSVQRSVRSATG